MTRVLALASKDLRLLARDRFGMFWVLIFPVLFALFFGAIFGGSGGGDRAPLPIAVVDEDDTDASRAYVDALARSPALDVARATEPEAAEQVRRGKRAAYVALRKGFGDSLGAIFFGGSPGLALGIDPSRKAEAGYLQGLLVETAFRAAAERGGATAPRGPEIETRPVVRAASRPRSPFEVTFPSAVLWAVLGCCAGFALSIVRERTAGTWLRLRVSPISRLEILFGKGLACFLASCGVTTALLLFAAAVLGVRLANPPLLALGIASVGLCFAGMMMLVCTIGRTEQSVAGAGWAVFTVMAMVGGGMVPLIAMPAWMLRVSDLSPVKWGILALEGAIWRDFSAAEMARPCLVLIAVGAACFAAGVRLLSRRES